MGRRRGGGEIEKDRERGGERRYLGKREGGGGRIAHTHPFQLVDRTYKLTPHVLDFLLLPL